MKASRAKSECGGFTLIEVLVIIALIAIVAAMLVSTGPHSGRARVPRCMSNLKQIDLGLVLFANDNQGRFPMQIPVANGGTMEFLYSEHSFPHFQKLKNYRLNPQCFICPFETNRQAAVSYETLNDLNISYFLNADASTNLPARTILAGDRCLQVNGQAIQPGLFVLITNLAMSWTPDFHVRGGNLAFVDGHVEFSKSNNLISLIQNQPLATNRLCIP